MRVRLHPLDLELVSIDTMTRKETTLPMPLPGHSSELLPRVWLPVEACRSLSIQLCVLGSGTLGKRDPDGLMIIWFMSAREDTRRYCCAAKKP